MLGRLPSSPSRIRTEGRRNNRRHADLAHLVADITGFQAHVYIDAATREKASTLREGLAGRFAVDLGRWHKHPVGPHTQAMYQVAFTPEQFANIVPWMMLNREAAARPRSPHDGR